MHSGGELNERNLARLVELFYARVRQDAEIGPIFNDAIHDWPEHLSKLTDFWHSVMLASGRFKGRPMMKHMMLKDQIKPEHFDRWLQMWADASNEVLSPENAIAVQRKARHIGESFRLGLFYNPANDDPARREAGRQAAPEAPKA